MIAIELRFITGKFHATPWGRQVNEGAVEWPPSPWRLLRALLAVWHLKFPDVPESEVRELIQALAATPSYRLPPSSSAHTRHYMPTTNDAKTKVFDAFIAIPRSEPLVVYWSQQSLTSEQHDLLNRLLSAIQYFGRAESWVEATLASEVQYDINAWPLDASGVRDDQELVRLLAPSDPTAFESWRKQAITDMKDVKLKEKREKAVAKGKPIEKVKLSAKENSAIADSIATTTFDAMQASTDQLRKAGWNRPPASYWVDYVRDVERPLPVVSRPRSTSALPTIVRFALAGSVLPRLTEALAIGERARTYLMGCSRKQNGDSCSWVFSAKTKDGAHQSSGRNTHSHAHFLAESAGPTSRGRITHLTVFAPAGFDAQDQAALSRFTHMHGSDGHDLQVVLLGIGTPADFGGKDERKGQSPALATSDVWISRTPLVPTDHLRIRNSERNDPARYQTAIHRELDRLVRKELQRRPWVDSLAESVEIDRVNFTRLGGTKTTWLKFRRTRQSGGGKQSTTEGYGFRLRFPKPIWGPISLGYGSHFGLGQFVAE